jgi:hypothetical protein
MVLVSLTAQASERGMGILTLIARLCKPRIESVRPPLVEGQPGFDARVEALRLDDRQIVRDPATQDWNLKAFHSMRDGISRSLSYFDERLWSLNTLRLQKKDFRIEFEKILNQAHVESNYWMEVGVRHSEYPGIRRDKIDIFLARPKSFRGEAPAYLQWVNDEFHLGEMIQGQLPIRGLPRSAWPRNYRSGVHTYPHEAYLKTYYELGADHLYEIRNLIQRGEMTEAREKIGHYYHVMLNARPYDQINNSLFSNQANYLLRLTGHPGFSQGHLDHLFMRMSSDQIDRFWPKVLSGEVKNARHYGFDIP